MTSLEQAGINTDVTKSNIITKDEKTQGIKTDLSINILLLTDTKEYIKGAVEGWKNVGKLNTALIKLPENLITEIAGENKVSKTLNQVTDFDVNHLNKEIEHGVKDAEQYNELAKKYNEAAIKFNKENPEKQIPLQPLHSKEDFAKMKEFDYTWMQGDKPATNKSSTHSGGQVLLNGVNGNNNMMVGTTVNLDILTSEGTINKEKLSDPENNSNLTIGNIAKPSKFTDKEGGISSGIANSIIPGAQLDDTMHDIQQANNDGWIVPATIIPSFIVSTAANTLHTVKNPIEMLPNLGAFIVNVPGSLINTGVQAVGGEALPITIPFYIPKKKPEEQSILINNYRNGVDF